MSELEPIQREVMVDLDPAQAFELFTARIGEWWPLSRLSVYGEGTEVAFADGKIVETHGERQTDWGEVTEWQPGERLTFTWHPGKPADQGSRVSVSFAAQGARTRVVLEHSGWEVFADPEAARREYEQGWPAVLDDYATTARRAAAYTWVALVHRPGPNAPAGGSMFEDPRFAEHTDFLSRMQAEGYLVAAGPLLDARGEGMTILRLPGEGRLTEAEHLATTEDASVREGFFEVSVRPWRVLMSGAGA